MITIRQATRLDVKNWLGNVPNTMRAWAADRDGEVLGICGIAQIDGVQALFSYVSDECLKYKKAIVKCAKECMKHAPPVVVAKSDPRFEGKMLRHLGFHEIEHSDGEWFIWQRYPQ